MEKLKFALGFFSLLILGACTAAPEPDLGPESPEVVIEKFLTQRPEIYRTETVMKIAFENPLEESKVSADYIIKQKSDISDSTNMLHDGSFSMAMDMKSPEFESIKINADAEMKIVGHELYVGYKDFKMDGNLVNESDLPSDDQIPSDDEINAIIATFINPYLNNVFLFSLEDVRPEIDAILKGIQKDTEMNFNLKDLEKYFIEEMKYDLAESKIIIVAKDFGIEEIESISGKKIQAYHYSLALNPEGLVEFIKTVNDRFNFVSSEELNEQLKANLKINEVVQEVNKALTFEIWLGKKDYHPYKVNLNANTEEIKRIINIANEEVAPLNEEEKKFLEAGNFSFTHASESEPIEEFELEKPTEGLINYTPFLKLILGKMKEEINWDLEN